MQETLETLLDNHQQSSTIVIPTSAIHTSKLKNSYAIHRYLPHLAWKYFIKGICGETDVICPQSDAISRDLPG